MERLQKVLARAGIASRRAAEQIILAGRVRVDGKIVRELGTQVDERRSRVEVDGTKIVAEKLVYIVLHKPRGVVCTLSDPEGRPTIKELLKDAGARVVPVGRLDFHTSGALICTNDGEFAQGLAHPKKEVPKVYVAKVKGTVDDDALPKFSQSIEIEGRRTTPAQVRRLRYEGDKTWLEITLREGRNRQVRKLGEFTGFPVMRLARISHAGVTSEDLRPGQWRPLTVDELIQLKKDFGVPKKVRPPQLAWDAGKSESVPRMKAWEKKESRGRGRGATAEKSEVRGERFDRNERDRDARFGRAPRGPAKAAFERDARSPARKGPLERDTRSSSRKGPFQRERAQSAHQDEPNRPWKSSSRSTMQAGPERSPPYGKAKGRPSTEKRPEASKWSKDGRAAAKPNVRARRDAPGSLPRRGTSR
jgi:23S rRNA pseudouridine2605 synthase